MYYEALFVVDSGTGEDYKKYYPPPPPPPSANASTATLGGQPRTITASGHHRPLNFCTSLPVRVPDGPGGRWPLKPTDDINRDMRFDDEYDETDDKLKETQPKDVGASMQALARSIQSADDPERLFGERPQRRRYKTGENFQPPSQQQATSPDVFPTTEPRRKATVIVLFKEGQNV